MIIQYMMVFAISAVLILLNRLMVNEVLSFADMIDILKRQAITAAPVVLIIDIILRVLLVKLESDNK